MVAHSMYYFFFPSHIPRTFELTLFVPLSPALSRWGSSLRYCQGFINPLGKCGEKILYVRMSSFLESEWVHSFHQILKEVYDRSE